tara:strand:+ start:77 stop:706 length:630 start_codon:yes stop_codon:yes gene_type:complete
MKILSEFKEPRSDGLGMRTFCIVRCECGDESRYDKGNIKRGNTTRCKKCANKSRSVKHNKHKMSDAYKKENPLGYATYCVYMTMKARCTNKNNGMYGNYGGRGISVCSRWLESFDNFIDDLGVKPSKGYQIDRINNDGNYELSNCRWATIKENARNKRNNFLITVDGETKTAPEWSEISGVMPRTIKKRIQDYGWDEKEAVFKKANKRV